MRTGKYAVRAKHDLFQRGVIAHDGNDHIAVHGCFFGSLGNGSTCDGLRFLPGAIIHRKMIPGTYQPRGHVATHVSHADEANGWFRLFLHGHDIALLSEKARIKRGTSPYEQVKVKQRASLCRAEPTSLLEQVLLWELPRA